MKSIQSLAASIKTFSDLNVLSVDQLQTLQTLYKAQRIFSHTFGERCASGAFVFSSAYFFTPKEYEKIKKLFVLLAFFCFAVAIASELRARNAFKWENKCLELIKMQTVSA